jgi:hypothetical protein
MKIKISVFIMLIVALILSACSIGFDGQIVEGNLVAPETGQVYALHLRSTLYGMQQAAKGVHGTKIFQNGNLITFVWSLKDGWAFATINTASKAPVQSFAAIAKNASFVNVKTMKDLISAMSLDGWKVIPASALPTAVTTALSGSMSWLVTAANSMTSFLVLPAGAFATPEILQEYEGIDL